MLDWQLLVKKFGWTFFSVVFHLFSTCNSESAPVPEDWVSNGQSLAYNMGDNTFISAFLNVSFKTDYGWANDNTEVGRYGGTYCSPAYGLLVHVTSKTNRNDHTGCQYPFDSSRPDGQLPEINQPWIALIKRGNCNFDVKVANAFRSRASAVLVYNDRDSLSLDKMKLSNDPRRNISAIFIYKWKGEELAKLLDINSEVYVHITMAEKPSRTANINRTSVLFVSITFIVLMIISLTWLVFYYVQRFRYIRTKDKLTRKLGNAAKKALSKIPTKSLRIDDKEIQGDGECCAVCIEPYKLSDVLRILPCGHEFHKSCIDPWLLEHRTCPMCKMDILKYYGFVFTGSLESILQIDTVQELNSGQDNQSGGNQSLTGRRQISPLPEIRAVILSEQQRQRFFDQPPDDDSSRASTPNEMTPSLTPQQKSGGPLFPPVVFQASNQIVTQEFCINCRAARQSSVSSLDKIGRMDKSMEKIDKLEKPEPSTSKICEEGDLV